MRHRIREVQMDQIEALLVVQSPRLSHQSRRYRQTSINIPTRRAEHRNFICCPQDGSSAVATRYSVDKIHFVLQRSHELQGMCLDPSRSFVEEATIAENTKLWWLRSCCRHELNGLRSSIASRKIVSTSAAAFSQENFAACGLACSAK